MNLFFAVWMINLALGANGGSMQSGDVSFIAGSLARKLISKSL